MAEVVITAVVGASLIAYAVIVVIRQERARRRDERRDAEEVLHWLRPQD